MKIALFGSGMIGQRVAQEALRRGHEVTAIVRDPARIQFRHPQLTLTEGNALNRESVTQVVAGYDVVVSAIKPSEKQPLSAVAELIFSTVAARPVPSTNSPKPSTSSTRSGLTMRLRTLGSSSI